MKIVKKILISLPSHELTEIIFNFYITESRWKEILLLFLELFIKVELQLIRFILKKQQLGLESKSAIKPSLYSIDTLCFIKRNSSPLLLFLGFYCILPFFCLDCFDGHTLQPYNFCMDTSPSIWKYFWLVFAAAWIGECWPFINTMNWAWILKVNICFSIKLYILLEK